MFFPDDEHAVSDSNGKGDQDDVPTSSASSCPTDTPEGEGWKQQFTCSGDRLKEALETYRFLGLEVKTVPLKELNCDGCTLCFDNEADETMMIFTRAKSD